VAAVPGVEPGCGASKAPLLAGGTAARVRDAGEQSKAALPGRAIVISEVTAVFTTGSVSTEERKVSLR